MSQTWLDVLLIGAIIAPVLGLIICLVESGFFDERNSKAANKEKLSDNKKDKATGTPLRTTKCKTDSTIVDKSLPSTCEALEADSKLAEESLPSTPEPPPKTEKRKPTSSYASDHHECVMWSFEARREARNLEKLGRKPVVPMYKCLKLEGECPYLKGEAEDKQELIDELLKYENEEKLKEQKKVEDEGKKAEQESIQAEEKRKVEQQKKVEDGRGNAEQERIQAEKKKKVEQQKQLEREKEREQREIERQLLDHWEKELKRKEKALDHREKELKGKGKLLEQRGKDLVEDGLELMRMREKLNLKEEKLEEMAKELEIQQEKMKIEDKDLYAVQTSNIEQVEQNGDASEAQEGAAATVDDKDEEEWLAV